jgi:hypothetical protein
MTAPKQAKTTRAGRTYQWPPLVDDPEFEFGSVTYYLQGVPKPGLMYWAAGDVANTAVKRQSAWMNMTDSEAVDWLKRAPWRYRDEKANIGTVAHAAIEAYIAGKPLPDLDDTNRGCANAGLKFLKEWDVQVVHSEATVFSRTHGYAGTLDIIADLPSYGLTVIDFKTGKKPYPEVGLQLSAYANADFIGTLDGVEVPMPDVRCGMVVIMRPDGGYEPYLVDIGQDQFDAFLHAKAIHEWTQGNHRVVGQELQL